ncbi:carbohydrate ABC transporter substrate-binding protein, CUT1 family [Litoreibacter ascidiaceicola]|uniref:Carbohydrate ABC transporter substrate-binding protein, CUT1 family n=1 Tax=Litoreibacter ascidiaceicola TaxID=1486859 RepID=A0A1M4T8M0_9RHOB|nr:extracellular solute-binding protein [Litoreibacter ascidiaceicola]SHE40829.1 carbohydrate ABC transporter substrate-binding protein, CUT1 family [Litoreibacter ascidiaceicola]
MKTFIKSTVAASALVVAAGAASAACTIDSGRVNIIGNEFPAIQTVAAAAAECTGATIESNLTADHQTLNVAGMSGNPAEYTSAIVANSSIVALINEDVIQPLDALVAEYGKDIPQRQLITVGGNIMAVAFMANSQTLAYRSDVLEEVGLDVPTSYEDVLVAAKAIRDAGIMENPVGGAYAAGWNLAQEFNNMYIGHGGEFFEPGTANISINNPQGVATLEMMKALTEYMNPDYLTHDSNGTQAEWEAGNVALMNMWGSRMQNLMDDEGSEPVVYENTKVSGPLMVGDSGVPATTLWWDGWTVAKNVSDEDAAATFQALVHAVSPEILNDTTMNQAVWLIEGYKPAPVSAGVLAAVEAGSKPYPMLPYMGLLHTASGDNIADFLTGKESAEQTLADIEAAYTAAAKEQGYVK